MSAHHEAGHCIGWPTLPGTRCTAWGYGARMHGCHLPNNHPDICECLCGATHQNPQQNQRRRKNAP